MQSGSATLITAKY